MPTYQFLNKETNEVEEYTFSVKLLDEFKQLNPHLETYHSVESLPVKFKFIPCPKKFFSLIDASNKPPFVP